MSLFDITSANATAVMTVESLFPAGIVLQQFAADTALSVDSSDITETRMGVDGYLAAGYTPNIFPVTINLEACSPSYQSLSQVWVAMRTNKAIYGVTLVCTIPAIQKVFTFSTGVMKSGNQFPALATVLEPTTWVFDFQNLDVSGV